MWLIDLERALALLVGQTLGSMLAGPGVSPEEKECEKWLSSPLLWNGLEDRDPERGTWFFVSAIRQMQTLQSCRNFDH